MLSAVLIDAGWLPPRCDADCDPGASDLLVALEQAWHGDAETGRGHARRRSAMLEWLGCCRSVDAALTASEALRKRTLDEAGMRECLVGWSRGIPVGRRIAMVSSRLGRRLNEAWYAAVRHGCRQLDPAHDVLVTAEDTASAEALGCAADLFGVRQLRIIPPRDGDSVAAWLRRLRRRWPDATEGPSGYDAWVSPPLAGRDRPELRGKADIPLRDQWLFDACDEVFVLSMRKGGNIERAVRRCLTLPLESRPTVRLPIGAGLVPEQMANELLESGAKAWSIPRDGVPDRPLVTNPLPATDRSAPIISVPPAADWPYLTHWTRDPQGPWPGESRREYVTKCVRGDPDCDRSALATLVHIVQTQQLTGTTQAIRGGEPVVCFTDMPLAELVQRRVFRSHRGQWDCESYGFCIRRSWLDRRGARPVYYGGDEDWERLSPDERPFFQLRQTRSRGDRRPIDWTQEREWRCRGSLDLRQLTAADGLLYVPSRAEARQLAAISRWPIVVLGTTG